MSQRIAIIHPEGNILYNSNLLGMVEILHEQGYAVDIYCPKRNIAQQLSYPSVKIIFYNPLGFLLENLRVPKLIRGVVKVIDESFFFRKGFKADLIIGVDKDGIIIASKMAKAAKIPYALISYEIFFERETSADFKRQEIEACRDIVFAVCQDPVRSDKLVEENKIPLSKIINIPVAGRSAVKGQKGFALHDEVGLNHQKHIVLYMGASSEWSQLKALVESAQTWGEEWVLVIHPRYGMDKFMKELIRPYKDSKKVFVSLSRIDSCTELTPIIKSADIGVALYQPSYASCYDGDNLKYLGLSSGKISAYLQHGLPVIVNEIGLWSENVKTYQLGFVTDGSIHLPSLAELKGYEERSYQFFEDQLDLNKTIIPLLSKLKEFI